MSSVLITGGTGSLGRSLIKKLINDDSYHRVVVFSRDEHKQAQMAEEFKSQKLRFFIGDVRDYERLKIAMSQINAIVHAAALKIVPSGEYNPTEYIQTNVMGTANVLKAAYAMGVRCITTISTDKAVAPINLYGATKLCAERLTIAANNMFPGLYANVIRYGNVANANSSVIPVFKRQIERKEPLTITDYEMTRFWIELDTAAQFVLDHVGTKEKGKIYIPKMDSFDIISLARAFHCGDKEFPHRIIGIREGEKLHEQITDKLFSNSPTQNFISWAELHDKLIAIGAIK